MARLVEELEDVPVPERTLLNVNCPAGDASGARVCRLGKRIYRDRLELDEEDDGPQAATGSTAMDPATTTEEGTDFAAIARRLHRGHAAPLRPDRHEPGWRRSAASTSSA